MDTASSYEAARVQAVNQSIKNLIARIERKAKEFTDTKVDGAPAPIVVPE